MIPVSPGFWVHGIQETATTVMKHILLSCVYLAATVVAAPPQPVSPNPKDASAPPPKTMDEVAPVIRPAQIIDVNPMIRPNAKRQLVRYGPFVLPAPKVRKTFLQWLT
jgi:hypothetical protein